MGLSDRKQVPAGARRMNLAARADAFWANADKAAAKVLADVEMREVRA